MMLGLRRLKIIITAISSAAVLLVAGFSSVWASDDCDKALSIYWKGRYSPNNIQAKNNYEYAIRLCPGFIRPYELLGNLLRKEGQRMEAIKRFTAAAVLGSTNYKLYYLLADLLFAEGKLDEAKRYLDVSLEIRSDYPKANELKIQIDKALDKEGPQVILFEPSTPRGIRVIRHFETATVRGLATDKSEVAWVRINGLDALNDTRGNFLKDVPIKPGTNLITIVAADTLGNSSVTEISIERPELPMPQKSTLNSVTDPKSLYNKSHAIIIGINQYDKWPPLEFAVNDAKAIEKKLSDSGFDQITTIFNEKATQRRILTELFSTLPQKVEIEDRVLFYFAGHGQTQELPNGANRGYIIPYDADLSDYSGSAISMAQVKSLSRRIKAKHIMYIMDSCYSGLGLSRSLGTSTQVSGYLKKVASMRAIQIVTAGGKGEQAQEREGHGIFTELVLEALDGKGDLNQDGVVTGTELGTYLRPRVSDASNHTQTPLFGRLEGEGDFLFFISETPEQP